jgi:nicotinamide mononucleotide transporter
VLSSIWDQFLLQLRHTSAWEWTAVCAGIASVLLAHRNHILLYPAGLISTSIYTGIFLQLDPPLFADAALNVYYFIMSAYGWWAWKRRSDQAFRIRKATRKEWMLALNITVLGTVLIYAILVRFTNSDVPLLDAILAASAWAGMWLLARHCTENWLFLNVSNLIAIPVYVYKGLPLTALLTVFLFVVAVSGYVRWRKHAGEAAGSL